MSFPWSRIPRFGDYLLMEETGCRLYKSAMQAVLGEGTRNAAVMLVGEQPDDQEDTAGPPFVGPAGS